MFVDENSNIDKEALRSHVLEALERIKNEANRLISAPSVYTFWTGLHDQIASLEDTTFQDQARVVETQLKTLPVFIAKWMEMSVDSAERLDFFIASKAEEIKSGDRVRDYFWALQIRHDQLIALVRVLDRLLSVLRDWVKAAPDKVLDDPVFAGLCEYSIEDQVYLEAETIHKLRKKIVA